MKLLLYYLCFVLINAVDSEPTPVVLWHGMSMTCCDSYMVHYQQLIAQYVPGVYTYPIRIGDSSQEDQDNGYLMNVNKQVQMACDQIAADPKLANGFNGIGFSQGGQFMRAVAQRCPNPPMKNYISMGGQMEGVFGLPTCGQHAPEWICEEVRRLLDMGAYIGWIQNMLVQAEYWHDPLNEQQYSDNSVFIADINNEKVMNTSYKENMLKLNNVLLVKFNKDSQVIPRESEWFGFYAAGQDKIVQNMTNRTLYHEDRIGLKTLLESGRLHFLSVEGDHMVMDDQTFIDEVIMKYLNN